MQPSIDSDAAIQPPPIHFPPLPRTPYRAVPVVRAAHALTCVQPIFLGWAPYKGFRYPYTPGPLSSAAAGPVAAIIQWGIGALTELPEQLKSELGLDDFNYQVQLRMPPNDEQRRDLKEYLLLWACTSPESLLVHLFHETVDQVLGTHFPWAVFGKAKTLSRTGRLPW